MNCSINQNCPPDQSIPQTHRTFLMQFESKPQLFTFLSIYTIFILFMNDSSFLDSVIFHYVHQSCLFTISRIYVKYLHNLVLDIFLYISRADYLEPPSPIQLLGVNPFRRKIIYRNSFRGIFFTPSQ